MTQNTSDREESIRQAVLDRYDALDLAEICGIPVETPEDLESVEVCPAATIIYSITQDEIISSYRDYDWSPDKITLAFKCVVRGKRSNSENRDDICLLRPDADEKVIVLTDLIGRSADYFDFSNPTWSQDGTTLVAVCEDRYTDIYGICLLDLNGKKPVQNLTKAVGRHDRKIGIHNFTFSLSPNGKKLAYGCESDLCILDIELLDQEVNFSKKVGFDTGTDKNPVWSPDGSKILYWCSIGSKSGICIANSDGSGGRKNITESLKALGYERLRYGFTNEVFVFKHCSASSTYDCESLGSPFELVDTLENFVDYDVDDFCSYDQNKNYQVCTSVASN